MNKGRSYLGHLQVAANDARGGPTNSRGPRQVGAPDATVYTDSSHIEVRRIDGPHVDIRARRDRLRRRAHEDRPPKTLRLDADRCRGRRGRRVHARVHGRIGHVHHPTRRIGPGRARPRRHLGRAVGAEGRHPGRGRRPAAAVQLRRPGRTRHARRRRPAARLRRHGGLPVGRRGRPRRGARCGDLRVRLRLPGRLHQQPGVRARRRRRGVHAGRLPEQLRVHQLGPGRRTGSRWPHSTFSAWTGRRPRPDPMPTSTPS